MTLAEMDVVQEACSLEGLVIHTVDRREAHTSGRREAHTAGHQEEEEADIAGRQVARTVGRHEGPPSITLLRSHARACPRPRRAAGCSPKAEWAYEGRLACPSCR